MTFDLSGRVALVTGGESGIGKACCVALAQAGADIAILYHANEDAAREVAAAVASHGRRAHIVRADVGTEADVERAFDDVAAALGTPDILVNSAGLNMTGVRVTDMPLEQWERVVRTDLTGGFLTSRRFARDHADGPAAIINITSIHEWAVRDGGADYVAAKAGQGAFTRNLALELAERGVTVNGIAPGMVLTPMNQEAVDDDAKRREQESHIPMKRAATPDEIAAVAVFLASPAAAYITGATITVDGGLSLVVAPGA